MATIAVVSFRLGGSDGVSIEAAKWMAALEALGHHITTVAGAGPVTHLLPGLAADASTPPSAQALSDALDGAELVIVENLASLPLNLPVLPVLYDVLDGRAALFHHHDLAWQRPHLAHLPGPQHRTGWAHVVINELSRRELLERGIEADVMRNRFDCDPPLGNREATRHALGIGDTPLLLFPSRAIPRKNVAAALQLANELEATLWLLGPSEDDYEDTLVALIERSGAAVVRGPVSNASIHDAYAACDLVVVPSTWEGFGNPVLESVTHRRPLALYPYPVARELMAFGFDFALLDDLETLRREVAAPAPRRRDHNLAVARGHFNLRDLPEELNQLLARRFPSIGN